MFQFRQNIGFEIPEMSDKELKFLQDLIKNRSGILIKKSQKSLFRSRLGRRLKSNQLKNWQQYIELLKSDGSSELEHFINAMTTNKTEFFREKIHFEHVEKTLMANRPMKTITAWIAASSYGHEAYSLAILFERLKESIGFFDYKILATDIDTSALQIAERGVYEEEIVVRDVSQEEIKTHFLRGKGQNSGFFKINPDLKRNIKFRHHNLCAFHDLVPLKFDFIFVRNVLIYFDEQTINDVITKLTNHLKPNGTLFTGLSESIQEANFGLHDIGPSIYHRQGLRNRHTPKAPTPSKQKEQAAPIPTFTAPPKLNGPIKVLVVDDSKVIRKLMSAMIEEEPTLELFGTANDPLEAEKLMKKTTPDVITLDIHMPHMSGIEYLEKHISARKIPAIMVSGLDNNDGELSLKSIELGAVDFIEKPNLKELKAFAPLLREKITAAFQSKAIDVQRIEKKASQTHIPQSLKKNKLIAIGSSTGGTVALSEILRLFPKNCPPIVIVQHIPAKFSRLLADRLNSSCPIQVVEAASGEQIKPGIAYIAPGDRHLRIHKNSDSQLIAKLSEGEENDKHVPAVDVLFESVAKVMGRHSVGVILTGMGSDGAQGLLSMKNAGAHTIAQDEKSSVVFGMPREAIQIGAVNEIVSLDEVCLKICQNLSVNKKDT